jgi:hypothetical protein
VVVLELSRQMALGGDVFGEEEYAAGIFVEAMDEAEARVVRAGAGQVDLPGEGVEDAVLLGAAENGGKLGWLCDRYQVSVFKEDSQIRLFDHKSPVDDILTQFYYEPKCW